LAGLQLGTAQQIKAPVGVALVAGAEGAWGLARRGDIARSRAGAALDRRTPLHRPVAWWLETPALPWAQVVVARLVTALGPLLYRIAYQPLAKQCACLADRFRGVHFALTGLGPV
jgi:hypothetical protein